MALTSIKYALAIALVMAVLIVSVVLLGSIDAQEAAYPGATMTPILNSPTPWGYLHR